MAKKYHGVIPPIITPVNSDETVDEAGFRSIIDYCLEGGLHGLFVAGTNGDTMALTQKERNHAIQIALDQVHGRVPVMCGVMDTSTKRVIENIKALEQMGGSCAVVTPVFYDRHTSQDETVRHFEEILKATSIDLALYNIPPFVGTKVDAATVIKITELDKRVVAYKDSSGAFTDFQQVLSHYRDTDFCVLQGITPHAITSLLLGADGFVPALSVCFPELFASAYEAAADRDFERAMAYNDLIRESSKILGMTKNATAATKYAVSLRGFTSDRVIAPQDPILDGEKDAIRMKVAEIDAKSQALRTRLN
nr:dihydrodipicolinate synthase family protein [uncultured Dysosmobacter sp.]